MTSEDIQQTLPVIVIGAGPVGLAAAAHLLEEGIPFRILEAGDTPAAAMTSWSHVRLFSPWRYVVDEAARRLLTPRGWTAPDPDSVPTGGDIVSEYLLPLAAVPEIADALELNTRAVSVTRFGMDKLKSAGREDVPFTVLVQSPEGERAILGAAVIDASGTYLSPNPLGSNGVRAVGEEANRKHLYYGIPDVLGRDRARFAGKRVGVVGSGHSAFNALLELAELHQMDGTEVTWFIRSGDTGHLWGGEDADQLSERGSLGKRARALSESGHVSIQTGFATSGVVAAEDGVTLESYGGTRSGVLDEVVVVTGFRPDLDLTRELRLDLDPLVEAPAVLAPLIDPNLHSCGTVPPHGFRELAHPEEGFFSIGMKSYGRAPTFLLMTGYEQARSVVKALAGDFEAASRVELDLPQTGVCNTNIGEDAGSLAAVAADCCAAPSAEEGEPAASASSCSTAAPVPVGVAAATTPDAIPDTIPVTTSDKNASGCC